MDNMKDNETVSDFGSSFWILLFHILGRIAMHGIGCGLLPHHVSGCVHVDRAAKMARVIEVQFGM